MSEFDFDLQFPKAQKAFADFAAKAEFEFALPALMGGHLSAMARLYFNYCLEHGVSREAAVKSFVDNVTALAEQYSGRYFR